MEPQTMPPGFCLCSHPNPIDPAQDGSLPYDPEFPHGVRIFFSCSHARPPEPANETTRSPFADDVAFALAGSQGGHATRRPAA